MRTMTQRRGVGRRRLTLVFVLAAIAAATTNVEVGGVAVPAGPCGTASSAPPAGGWEHVALIVFENKSLKQVIGNTADAPYLNSLASQCASSTNMWSLTLTSLANYVALTSGYTGYQNGREVEITSNKDPTVWPQSSVSLFEAMGPDALQLAESMPSNCYLKGSGNFVVNHTAYQYYTRIRTPLCPQYAVPLTASSNPLAARFNLIIPNKINDMHKSPTTTTLSQKIRAGDNWSRDFIPRLLASDEYQAGKTAIILTWDEGNKRDMRVPFIVLSPSTPPGSLSAVRFNHYSVLKGIQEMLGVPGPFLGHAGDAGTASIRTDPALGLG